MLFLAYKASTINFDLVVEGDYYRAETMFNDLLIAKGNAEALGDEFDLNVEGDKLTLVVPKNLSENLEEGSIEFYCVSDKTDDRYELLSKNNNGVYYFNRQTVAPGKNYLVKVGFKSEGKEYFKEFTMR